MAMIQRHYSEEDFFQKPSEGTVLLHNTCIHFIRFARITANPTMNESRFFINKSVEFLLNLIKLSQEELPSPFLPVYYMLLEDLRKINKHEDITLLDQVEETLTEIHDTWEFLLKNEILK